MSRHHTFYREDDTEITIEYTITSRGCSAYTSGPPEDCYPAEAPEFEIGTAWIENEDGSSVPVVLSDEEYDKIYDELINLDFEVDDDPDWERE